MTNYETFLDGKRKSTPSTGFEPKRLNDKLYDFQRDIVAWACRKRAQRDQQAAWMREKRAKDAKEGNA